MRSMIIAAAAAALLSSPALAQSSASSRMTTPCPLHLETLALTPTQDSAFAAIRAAHRAEMHAVHEKTGTAHHASGAHASGSHAQHDAAQHAKRQADHGPMKEAMQASMKRTLEAARAVLGTEQLAKFDAAVQAHDDEKKAIAAKGGSHSCADCCPDHDAMHEKHHGTAKKEG